MIGSMRIEAWSVLNLSASFSTNSTSLLPFGPTAIFKTLGLAVRYTVNAMRPTRAMNPSTVRNVAWRTQIVRMRQFIESSIKSRSNGIPAALF